MIDTLADDIDQVMTAMVARHTMPVPPYPAVAMKLANLVESEGYQMADVVQTVAADAVLSADILRCANSSVYSRGIEVKSLQQAVARVGSDEIVFLALASALSKTTHTPGVVQTLKRLTWQCDLASALVCQALAPMRRLPADDAFLCGLLHDYGELIALAALEEILAALPLAQARPVTFWMQLIDRVHVKLGLLLASRWNLPGVFQDVIAMHHTDPATWTGAHTAMTRLVAASDAIVAATLEQPNVDHAALDGIVGLSDAERTKAVQLIPGIPSVIASFETDAGGRQSVSVVAMPDTTLPEGFRAVELAIEQLKPRRRGPYTMRGIAAVGWVMTGKEPIPMNQLIEVSIATPAGHIEVWAHATLCTPDPEGARIECRAFAANAVTTAKLYDLYRGAGG